MLGEVLEVLVRCGEYNTAQDVLKEATATPQAILGFLPAQALTTLLTAAVERQDAETAVVSAVIFLYVLCPIVFSHYIPLLCFCLSLSNTYIIQGHPVTPCNSLRLWCCMAKTPATRRQDRWPYKCVPAWPSPHSNGPRLPLWWGLTLSSPQTPPALPHPRQGHRRLRKGQG